MGDKAAGSAANKGATKKRPPSGSDDDSLAVSKKHTANNSRRRDPSLRREKREKHSSGLLDEAEKMDEAIGGLPINQQQQEREKKLLERNVFHSLKDSDEGNTPATQQQQRKSAKQNATNPERKEKCPPIFAKGNPEKLRSMFRERIADGSLKCILRLCTDGVKIMVVSKPQYYRVLDFLKKEKIEYYTHDIPSDKPLKVLLRGLEDMDLQQLENDLVDCGLKPTNIFKITRMDKTRKYRDQLYLVHIERGSITMRDLKTITVVNSTSIEWERYKPKHRDVTQCLNCQQFGHGTRNCHLAPRCTVCGENHSTDKCVHVAMEKVDPVQYKVEPKCANCGDKHQSTAKDCPKRAEFIQIRKKASIKNQPNRRGPPALNDQNWPELSSQPKSAQATTISYQAPPMATNRWPPPPPPGLQRQPVSETGRPEEAAPLYSAAQLVPIYEKLFARLRECKTRTDQIYALGLFAIENAF